MLIQTIFKAFFIQVWVIGFYESSTSTPIYDHKNKGWKASYANPNKNDYEEKIAFPPYEDLIASLEKLIVNLEAHISPKDDYLKTIVTCLGQIHQQLVFRWSEEPPLIIFKENCTLTNLNDEEGCVEDEIERDD